MKGRVDPRAAAAGLALLLLAAAPLASAWEWAGTKQLVAHTRDGQRIVLGRVHFESAAAPQTFAFDLRLDAERFTDHFLSMKEFKCIEGRTELSCHVPYPYPQPGTVTPTNLAWLEHSLLFLTKQPSEFGAKLWNGVYYQFELTPQGLRGRPQAVDLNRISAPPDRPEVPPLRKALRDDMPAGARWIAELTIE